jgi:hypothetical protein
LESYQNTLKKYPNYRVFKYIIVVTSCAIYKINDKKIFWKYEYKQEEFSKSVDEMKQILKLDQFSEKYFKYKI